MAPGLSRRSSVVRIGTALLRNRPTSLADACLVRLPEIHPAGRVFALDSDFRVYGRHGNPVIPVLMPE
jgi:predicted nucleic acid-binding protein